MKNITKSILRIGAFACLSACYGVTNAATLNISLKKSDNTGFENAIVTYKLPGYTYFGLLGYTDANGNLTGTSHQLPKLGEYILEIYAGKSLIRDTFIVNSADDIINISNVAKTKYIKYTNSANVPYEGETVKVINTQNSGNQTLITDARGVASFETFDNAYYNLETSKFGQKFVREYASNEGDTMYLQTVALKMYWPHSLSYGGNNGNAYVINNNNASKTIEVLPAKLNMKFSSTQNVTNVTTNFSFDVPFQTHVKNYEYTPVQYRMFTAEGTLATALELPITYNDAVSSNVPMGNIKNGSHMAMVIGNKTDEYITGTIKHLNRTLTSSPSKVYLIKNCLDFQLAKLTINTTADVNNQSVTYAAQTSGVVYETLGTSSSNTAISVDVIPQTYAIRVTCNNTMSHKSVVINAGLNNLDLALNKVTYNYVNINNLPLAGGNILNNSSVSYGTTDIDGKVVTYRFIDHDVEDHVKLLDASRNFNKYAIKTQLVAGQDKEITIVNDQPVSTISDMLTLNTNVNVYPNPATDYIQVKMDAAQGEVYIYNTVGQLVYNNSNVANNETINVSSLPTGAYNVVIVANDKKETVRVIKN